MTDDTQSADEITILVDFPGQQGMMEAGLSATPDQLLARSSAALDLAMETIEGMAQRVGKLKDRFPDDLTQAEIDFGVKLDAEVGALLAKAGGEASINVKLIWVRKE